MNAFSSGGENGTGVSGAATRFTGASRSSNASSAIVAEISAPKPPVRVSSCSTSTFDVFRTDSSTAALSHGSTVRRSMISTETPSPLSCCAASSAVCTIAPHVITETSSPSRCVRALPIGIVYRSSDTSALMRRYRCLCSKKRTGFGSSIALIRSPFASSGVDGQTHFRPGMWANDDSGFCEWNGPPEKPPPDGRRTTIGTAVPARQRCLAATVTRWSQPHEMKSANCISATGRIPMMAAPVQAPRIAVSASGASMTRHGPNSSWKPSDTLKAPPYTPTSSPIRNTFSLRRISPRSPSEIAWRYVISAIGLRLYLLVVGRVEVLGGRVHALQERRGIGHRRVLRAPERVVQDLLHVVRDLGLFLVGHRGVLAQPRAVPLDRVARRPALEHHLRHVERVVVHGMALHAERHAFEQRRAAALACL